MNRASTSSSSEQPVKKRRTNVNKACENCRRRRVKCDGVRPSCGTCAVYKDDCQWEAREDYRKPLSRKEVQALVTRMQGLEKNLRDLGHDPGTPTEDPYAAHEAAVRRKAPDQQSSTSDTKDELALDHLVEREDGDIHLHGPTSAFRHFGKYPQLAGGLNVFAAPVSHGSLPTGFTRYLPPGVPISQIEHDRCVDRFFSYYACWGLRSNVLYFKQHLDFAVNAPFFRMPHYSPLLHNAILAIALGFSDEPYLRNPALRLKFAEQAKTFIDEEGMRPSIATVQAFAHLASYHSLAAEHNLGWLYMGMGVRCAVALGLNTDDSRLLARGHVTSQQVNDRNNTFWTIYIQEGVWAPYIGRSISLPAYTTHPPSIDVELDRVPWEPLTYAQHPLSRQPALLSTTFSHTVKLMMIGEKIMHNLYEIRIDLTIVQRNAVVNDISIALADWLKELPPSLQLDITAPSNALPHILMMHLSHAWLVILLHRPFYRPLVRLPTREVEEDHIAQSGLTWAVNVSRPPSFPANVLQCDQAAVHVIHLLQLWDKLHDLRFSPPTAIQVCFVSGTTHLLSLASTRSNSRRQAESFGHVQECARLLECIAKSWPAAAQAKILLESLRDEYGLSIGSTNEPRESVPAVAVVPSTELQSYKQDPPIPTQLNIHNPTLAPERAVPSLVSSPTGHPYPLYNQSAEWPPPDGTFGGQFPAQPYVDPDIEALLDTILRPHLGVGLEGFDQNQPSYW